MTNKIHPTAIINKGSKIDKNVEIGPFSIIGPNVEIGEGCIIKSHVVIEGFTSIGAGNIIFPFATIGQDPQDLKFRGEETRIIIGDNNRIREHVTIHPGTKDDNLITKIGSNCLFMVGAHIAHDCIVGNNVILANNATLAGHVKVGDFAIVGGLSAVHQFVRIGHNAMIGGMSGVEHDVIPYGLVMGKRASLAGLNIVGLKRKNFAREEIHALRAFYKELFESASEANFKSKIADLKSKYPGKELIQNVINFLEAGSDRSILQAE